MLPMGREFQFSERQAGGSLPDDCNGLWAPGVGGEPVARRADRRMPGEIHRSLSDRPPWL